MEDEDNEKLRLARSVKELTELVRHKRRDEQVTAVHLNSSIMRGDKSPPDEVLEACKRRSLFSIVKLPLVCVCCITALSTIWQMATTATTHFKL